MDKRKKRLLHAIISIALITLGIVGLTALTASKRGIKKRKTPVPLPMVKTIPIKTGPQKVIVLGEGTVRPLREIDLVPEVGGKVVYVSSALVNGGEFSNGDILLRIDPADYQLAVTLAKAKVKDSESGLKLAREEAAAAKEEWRRLYGSNSKRDEEPPPLVAKKPQLAAAQAKLEADRANLRKAILDLQRTELKAPFAGRVGSENVDVGQYVSPGQPLGALYSTEAVEITLPMEDEKLFWFYVPGFTDGHGHGSPATVHASVAGQELTWEGRVVRSEGKLDERTRMVNVVVQVKDPYAKKPPLAAGLFVTVDIKGRTLPNASVIPRSTLHQGNIVWIVDQKSRLHFREVEVALLQGDEALIRAGLESGDRLVTTPLKAVTNGMKVRTVPEARRFAR